MTLTIDAPSVENQLQLKAAQQGISTEEYALRLLEAHLAGQEPTQQESEQRESEQPEWEQGPVSFHQKASTEEWLQRFRSWVESHKDFPVLSPQAFERASFYEGRPG